MKINTGITKRLTNIWVDSSAKCNSVLETTTPNTIKVLNYFDLFFRSLAFDKYEDTSLTSMSHKVANKFRFNFSFKHDS